MVMGLAGAADGGGAAGEQPGRARLAIEAQGGPSGQQSHFSCSGRRAPKQHHAGTALLPCSRRPTRCLVCRRRDPASSDPNDVRTNVIMTKCSVRHMLGIAAHMT